MNYFYFYLSDNDDFRLECESYPEITSALHYSKDEIRNLQKLAKKYHIKIVPVIDMPGHMGAILKHHKKELCLTDTLGGVSDQFIDITLDTARSFVKNLLEEYLELFDGPFWHMAADEYKYTNLHENPQFLSYAQNLYGEDAISLDALFDFINWVNGIVRSHGKILRIYNDAMSVRNSHQLKNKVTIDKNIIVDYWEGLDSPIDYIQEGYKINNSASNYLYYNIGSGWLIYNFFIYEGWETYIYNELKEVPKNHPLNLGARLHVWCNTPRLETEGHIANEIRNTLKILATKLWGGPKLVEKYLEFEKICQNIGLAPGVSYPENPIPDNLCWKKKVYASSTKQDSIYYPEMLNDASYNSMWKSNSNKNEWIIVDLDSLYILDYIKVMWFSNKPKDYKIQVSKDSINWLDIFSEIDSTERRTEVFNIAQMGRYVKIVLNRTKDSTFTMWEIEAYGKKYIDTSIQPKEEENIDFEIKLFPNPVVSSLEYKVDLINPYKINVKIMDLNGKINYSTDLDTESSYYSQKIDLSGYANGGYIITVQVGSKVKSQKFLVLKEKQ
jgi:hexosaminidase